MGNPTGSPAAPSAITLGANLSFSGSTLVAAAGGGMTNPMTTTGDTIYASSGSTPARLGIGTNGYVLSVVSGLPAWAATTTITTVGTISTGTWQGNIIGVAYGGTGSNLGSTGGAGQFLKQATSGANIAPTAIVGSDLAGVGSSGQIIFNSGGTNLTGASQLTVQAVGQLNSTPVSDPASPVAGDLWYSSGNNTFGIVTKGLVAKIGGIVWSGLSSGSAFSNSSSQVSLISGTYGPSSTAGSLTIPANSLKPGTVIRPRFFGTMMQATPKLTMSIYLGSTLVWSVQTPALTSNATAQDWLCFSGFQCSDLLVQSIGSSGSVIGTGSAFCSNAAGASNNLSCGTATTTQTSYQGYPVSVTVNTTLSLTLDFQVQFSSVSSSNSIQFLGGYLQIDG